MITNRVSSVTTCKAIALVALLLPGLALYGCSAQTNSPKTPYSANERAALASDSPYPFHPPGESDSLDYDPWESVNERTFDFNFNVLDHYALKPTAKVWADTFPEQVRHSLANAFDNIAMPRRFVNKLLQGRLPAAGEELARFVLNSTIGFAGFFDVASHMGLEKSDADTGQTLGVYGVKPGPYLVLPVLPPLTVRDAIGYAADSFMDPLSWLVTPLAADFGRSAAYIINERADNMTMYDDVEDTSLDLYAAVRNGYLQKRQKSIRNAIKDRNHFWEKFSTAPAAQDDSPQRDSDQFSTE